MRKPLSEYRKIRKIILHHSATEDTGTLSWGAIKRFHIFKKGWKDIGYHFGVEFIRDSMEELIPTVMFGRPLVEEGAHTRGQNKDSIGICVVGNYDNTEVPDELRHETAKLCAVLCDIFGLSEWDIFGHRNFAAKSCPGKNFDLGQLRNEVRRIREGWRS